MGIDEIREVDALANRLRAKMHGERICGFTLFNNPGKNGNDQWRARAWLNGRTQYIYIGRDVTAAERKITGWLADNPEAAKLLQKRQAQKSQEKK